MTDNRVRIGIAVIVTCVWAASYVLSLVNHSYHPPPGLDAIMPIVAGFFFAQGLREQGRRIREADRDEVRELIKEEQGAHEHETQ